MEENIVLSAERYGYDFIPAEFLPAGKDEYWLRDSFQSTPKNRRKLSLAEIEVLVRHRGLIEASVYAPSLRSNISLKCFSFYPIIFSMGELG